MGYFTLSLSEMVGNKGIVYAVDIQKKKLDIIHLKAKQKNIKTFLITDKGLNFEDIYVPIGRKFFEDSKYLKMPLSVQVHHAPIDGIHIGRFCAKVQDYLHHPGFILGEQ